MRLGFVLPHTKCSGGVKVVLRLAEWLTLKGVNVIVLAHRVNDITWLYPKKPKYEIKHVAKVSKYTIPNDVTHLIDFADGTPFGPIPDIPHILFLQGFGSQQYDRECLNMLYPWDLVIATSHWLADLAQKLCRCPVGIVPPGIDATFKPQNVPQEGLVIGGLYHPAPEKNVSLFSLSLAKIQKTLDKHVRALLLSAQIPQNVDVLEAMGCSYSLIINPPQHMLPSMYSSCGLWISTSSNEGFGLTTLEAMACGVPVIQIRNFGLDEYLQHRIHCLLVQDKNTIVAAANALLNDKPLRDTLIKNGREFAVKFTWDKMADRFIEALGALK
jgi:glycosyltransferase involved in cell wall biosynthesis